MKRAPGVGAHACPNCNGIEWATTDKLVVRKPRNWMLQRLVLWWSGADIELAHDRQRTIIAKAIWAYQGHDEHFGRLCYVTEGPSMHGLVRQMTIDEAERIRAELQAHGELWP